MVFAKKDPNDPNYTAPDPKKHPPHIPTPKTNRPLCVWGKAPKGEKLSDEEKVFKGHIEARCLTHHENCMAEMSCDKNNKGQILRICFHREQDPSKPEGEMRVIQMDGVQKRSAESYRNKAQLIFEEIDFPNKKPKKPKIHTSDSKKKTNKMAIIRKRAKENPSRSLIVKASTSAAAGFKLTIRPCQEKYIKTSDQKKVKKRKEPEPREDETTDESGDDAYMEKMNAMLKKKK